MVSAREEGLLLETTKVVRSDMKGLIVHAVRIFLCQNTSKQTALRVVD